MDNALVRRPPEKQGGIPLFKYERTVHKGVYVRQKHSKMRVRTDLLYGKSRPAPDSLGSFGFDAAGKFREGLHLKEWVASAEGNIGDSVSLDDFHNLLHKLEADPVVKDLKSKEKSILKPAIAGSPVDPIAAFLKMHDL